MFPERAWALIIAQVCMRYKWHICVEPDKRSPAPAAMGPEPGAFAPAGEAMTARVETGTDAPIYYYTKRIFVECGCPSTMQRSWDDRLGVEPQRGRSDPATGSGRN